MASSQLTGTCRVCHRLVEQEEHAKECPHFPGMTEAELDHAVYEHIAAQDRAEADAAEEHARYLDCGPQAWDGETFGE